MLRRTAATAALISSSPAIALADVGYSVQAANVWYAWNLDLLILLNLVLLGFCYIRGWKRLRHRAGSHSAVSRSQAVAFFGSLAAVFVALISPLDALSGELASAHMVQHMLLVVAAAPLLVFGSPTLVLLWGIERPWRPAIVAWGGRLRPHALYQPLASWLIYASVLWVWHIPVLYEAALHDPLVHDMQHLSFFGAGCLFWRGLLDPRFVRGRSPVISVVSLFTTSLHASLLGIYMALSPTVWYGHYASRTVAWGLTAGEDQQLAGLIMWMPSCLIYPAVAAGTFGLWLAATSRTGEKSFPVRRKQTVEGG